MNYKLLRKSLFQKGVTSLHLCLKKSTGIKKVTLEIGIRLPFICWVYLLVFSSSTIVMNPQQCFARKNGLQVNESLNTKLVNQYARTLKVHRRSLINSLKQLEQMQEIVNKSKGLSRQKASILRKINKHLNKIYQVTAIYFQAERSQELNHQRYLGLRKRVWKLLDRRVNLFQSSQGRFCLRANWERLIAQNYLSLNRNQLAQHHFLRAYRCDGSVDDLNKAKNIRLTIH